MKSKEQTVVDIFLREPGKPDEHGCVPFYDGPGYIPWIAYGVYGNGMHDFLITEIELSTSVADAIEDEALWGPG